jgi:hypothetical protein
MAAFQGLWHLRLRRVQKGIGSVLGRPSSFCGGGAVSDEFGFTATESEMVADSMA